MIERQRVFCMHACCAPGPYIPRQDYIDKCKLYMHAYVHQGMRAYGLVVTCTPKCLGGQMSANLARNES